jgi:hypothetical protein
MRFMGPTSVISNEVMRIGIPSRHTANAILRQVKLPKAF